MVLTFPHLNFPKPHLSCHMAKCLCGLPSSQVWGSYLGHHIQGEPPASEPPLLGSALEVMILEPHEEVSESGKAVVCGSCVGWGWGSMWVRCRGCLGRG